MGIIPWLLVILCAAVIGAFADAAGSAPCPGGVDADLWVCAGQSNMAGAGLITKKYRPNPVIMMFNMNNTWIPAVPPTHRMFEEGVTPGFKKKVVEKNGDLAEQEYQRFIDMNRKKPLGGVGPDLFFAQHILEHTSRRIGLIPCALGATSMADWDPAASASLYASMMQRIAMVGGKIKGILWYQGEGETNPEAETAFEKTFLNLVDCIRRDTGIPDLPFIYVQISRVCLENQAMGPDWETIREKQRTVASKRANFFMVPAIDLPLEDLIHIATAGQERLGRRMAEVALDKVYQQEGHATAIDYDSCEILPKIDDSHNKMRVRFKGINGKLCSQGRPTGFELRSDDPNNDGPCVYKVEFDSKDPASVIIWYTKPITQPVRLYYGAGLNPYVNIVDSKDMAVPAFGPVDVHPKK